MNSTFYIILAIFILASVVSAILFRRKGKSAPSLHKGSDEPDKSDEHWYTKHPENEKKLDNLLTEGEEDFIDEYYRSISPDQKP